ncbi:hypothetical protein B0T22DRAFT_537292 [Podospora appendiculata]|uniref:Uncharacterized protein n=1 Tax=Podospora appendiculata TaxID=314037 RepID=A0AAE0X4G6_9PEZI|nr:hypothetical protein B0T22DRAFT_537292 [Podospora appendiculata]
MARSVVRRLCPALSWFSASGPVLSLPFPLSDRVDTAWASFKHGQNRYRTGQAQARAPRWDSRSHFRLGPIPNDTSKLLTAAAQGSCPGSIWPTKCRDQTQSPNSLRFERCERASGARGCANCQAAELPSVCHHGRMLPVDRYGGLAPM